LETFHKDFYLAHCFLFEDALRQAMEIFVLEGNKLPVIIYFSRNIFYIQNLLKQKQMVSVTLLKLLKLMLFNSIMCTLSQ